MALREYEYAGGTYQFDEDTAPQGAVLVETKAAPKPANKLGKAPVNKEGASGNRKPGRKSGNTAPASNG